MKRRKLYWRPSEHKILGYNCIEHSIDQNILFKNEKPEHEKTLMCENGEVYENGTRYKAAAKGRTATKLRELLKGDGVIYKEHEELQISFNKDKAAQVLRILKVIKDPVDQVGHHKVYWKIEKTESNKINKLQGRFFLESTIFNRLDERD